MDDMYTHFIYIEKRQMGDYMFHKNIGLEEPMVCVTFLLGSKLCIIFEEKLLAEEVERGSGAGKLVHSRPVERDVNKRQDERD